jgi:hypothetical protein
MLKQLVPDVSLQWVRDEWNWPHSWNERQYVKAFHLLD